MERDIDARYVESAAVFANHECEQYRLPGDHRNKYAAEDDYGRSGGAGGAGKGKGKREQGTGNAEKDIVAGFRWSAQMFFEKFEGALACFLCGGGVVAGTRVAVEGVAGVVPEDFNFRVRGVNLLDVGGGNVRVLTAEVEHDGAGGIFAGVVADAASVVADGRGGMKTRGGEPGHGAAEAIADNADLF